MVSFGGDKWHPPPERHGLGNPEREGILKSRTNDSFWRRDRLEGERDKYTSSEREHVDKRSTVQVERERPLAELQDATHLQGRPRSSSMTIPTERPRLQVRQVSQGPSPSKTLSKPSHLIDSPASHSEFTGNAHPYNTQMKGTDPPADLPPSTRTLDPRLKHRINTAAPPQTGAGSPTMLSDGPLNQPRLIEKLIDIKLREQKQMDDHRKILKLITELESESDQAVQQFGSPNPYSVQLSETITSTRLRANILQQQLRSLKKEEESCRQALSVIHDNCASDNEFQRLKEGLSQQERENAVKAEEIKELKQQIERLADRMDNNPIQPILAPDPQPCPQEHNIKTLELMVAEIKAAIEIERSTASGISGQLVEVRRNVKQIQDTDFDSLRAEVKEQKLALARLNDVFVTKDSLENLQRRCDELQAKSASASINTKKYVSYEDLNTYIQKFNTFELRVCDRLHKLETQDLVKSTELKTYARTDTVAEVVKSLVLEQEERNNLKNRMKDLQTVSSENLARIKDHASRFDDIRSNLNGISPKLDGISDRLQAVESKQSTSATTAVAEQLSAEDRRQLQQMPNLKQDVISIQQRLQNLNNNFQNNNHSITSLSERFNKLKTDDLAHRIVGRMEPMLSTIKPQLLRLHAQDQQTQNQLKQINGLCASLNEGLTKAKSDTAEAMTAGLRAAETMKDFQMRASKIEDNLKTMASAYPNFQAAQDELKESQKIMTEGLRDTVENALQSREELQEKLADLQCSIRTMEHELYGLRDETRADSTSMKHDVQIEQEKLLNQFIEARDTFNVRLEEMEIRSRQQPDPPSSTSLHDHVQSPTPQASQGRSLNATESVENAVLSSTNQVEPRTTPIRATRNVRTRTHSVVVRSSPVDRSFDSSASETPIIPKIEDCFIPNRDDDSGGTIDATPWFRPKSGKSRAISTPIAIPDSDDEIVAFEPSRSEVENSAQSSDPEVPEVDLDKWVGKVPRKRFKSAKRVNSEKATQSDASLTSIKTPDKRLKLKRKRGSPAVVMRNARSTDSSQSTSQAKAQSEKRKKVKN